MCTFLVENWKDIVVSFIGAFFGFGLALILEYLKKKSDKKKEKDAVLEEMKKKIEYFKILLEEVFIKSNKQIELIQQNIEEQSKNYLNLIPLKYIPTNFFTRLKNIDSRGVFESLIDKFKNDIDWIKKYNELNSYLDFIEGTFCKELERINNTTLKKGFSDLLYIKSLIDEIPNILAEEARIKTNQLGNSRIYDKEYVFIDSIIKSYSMLVKETSDLDRFDKELLMPILQNIKPFESNGYAIKVILNCKNARVRMNDIRNDVKYTVSEYQTIINNLKNPLEEINKMIKLLS